MKCKFCETELLEGAAFCGNCGKTTDVPSVENEQSENVFAAETEAVEENLPATQNVAKQAKKVNLDIIVGTIIMVIGVIRLFSSGVSVSSTSFGADFYTYSYQGIVACAEMLGKLNVTVSWLIIGFGAAINLKGVKKK